MYENTNPTAFDYFDLNLEEAIQESKNNNTVRNTSKEICVCGHPTRRHKPNSRGEIKCVPNAMICKCKEPRPVLKAQDIRPFLRKTTGGGLLHALARGLATCVERGLEIEWLIPMACDKCHTETKVVPTPVNQNGTIANDETGYNALLCQTCRTQIGA